MPLMPPRDRLPDGHPLKGVTIHFYRNPRPAPVGSDPVPPQAPAPEPKKENDHEQDHDPR